MSNKRIIGVLIVFLFIAASVSAQYANTEISGKIIDKENLPLEGVTVVLSKRIDSVYVTGSVSDLDGRFKLMDLKPGSYMLTFSVIGFRKEQRPIDITTNKLTDVGNVVLTEDSYQLSAVTVTGTQPPVVVEAGKTTFNIGTSILSSQGNLLDAFKNLPGVIIRNDGAVMLNGESGATIMIDNKPSHLTGENLVNMLRSMPVTSINKIELIVHPSSRYDASGNSGIINIQTKKTKIEGFSFTPNVDVKQGRYTKENIGFNLSLRKDKLSFRTDYSYFHGIDFNQLTTDMKYLDEGNKRSTDHVSQESFRKFTNKSHYLRIGLDYDLSAKTSIGIYFSYSPNRRHVAGDMNTYFFGSSQVDSTLITANNNKMKQRNNSGGINFTHKVLPDAEWNTSFNYLLFRHNEDQLQNSYFVRTSSVSTHPDTIKGAIVNDISMYSGQTDFSYPLSTKLKLSAGIKTTFVSIGSSAFYAKKSNNDWITDQGLTNEFDYDENINAGYVQLNASISPQFQFEAGLRLENTNIEQHLEDYLSTSPSSSNSYTHLFPSFSLQYNLENGNSFSLLYNRRIKRPNYRDLNPFVYMFDQYTYEQGNTELKPELIDNIGLSFVLKKQYSANLFFMHTTDPIAKSYLVEDDNKAHVMPKNMSSNIACGIRVNIGNFKPVSWWSVSGTMSGAYKSYKWMFSDKEESNHLMTAMIGVNNQFFLPKGWSAELNGFYNGKIAEGQALVHPMYMASVGVKKSVLKDCGSIKIYVNDVFSTYKVKVDVADPVFNLHVNEHEENLTVGVSFTYRLSFGSKMKEKQAKTGIDESKRINL